MVLLNYYIKFIWSRDGGKLPIQLANIDRRYLQIAGHYFTPPCTQKKIEMKIISIPEFTDSKTYQQLTKNILSR